MNKTSEDRITQLRKNELDLELWNSLYSLCDEDERRKLGAIKYLYSKNEKEVIKIVKCRSKTLSSWIDKFLVEGLDSLVKTSIRKYEEFEKIYPTLGLGSDGFDLVEIVNRIEKEVVKKYNKPLKQGSLNNCRGTWHELAFVMEAHRSILRSTKDLYLIKMGNEISIKFWEIYNQESREKYQSLVGRLNHKDNPIFIRCSTPDFVVVSRDVISNSAGSQILQSQSPSLLEINELYKVIKSNCTPDRIKGFISLKTSNRPDRRYQILVEANVTKFASKYIHPPDCPLRFDVIGESNSSDIEVFKAPLMSTLPLTLDGDIDLVERAIDDETNITSSSQLDSYWGRYK